MSIEEHYIRNSSDLPGPEVTRRITLDDESASKSGHGTLHLFKLPKIGDYLWDFRLCSHALVRSSGDPAARWSHNPIHHVESIMDYVESAHFCTGNPENSIAWVQNGTMNNHQRPSNFFGGLRSPAASAMHCDTQLNLEELLCAEMGFFRDMPLIAAGLDHEDLYIGLKFRKEPPMKYFIDYNVGFLTDQAIINRIKEGLVRCETGVLQGCTYEPRVLNYQFGCLGLD